MKRMGRPLYLGIFAPGPFRPMPSRSASYNRGAYLVVALANCGEWWSHWGAARRPKVKGAMREAIDDGLKYLTDNDREAIADYLFPQPVQAVVRKR